MLIDDFGSSLKSLPYLKINHFPCSPKIHITRPSGGPQSDIEYHLYTLCLEY